MEYENVKRGIFLERPNRFIAHVEVETGTGGERREEVCHVKNTGRCRELLTPGAEVYVQYFSPEDAPARKTRYDVIAVKKDGKKLINMDAQAPNKVFAEWAAAGHFLSPLQTLRSEAVWGNSRFDFYLETPRDRIFVEVKGVTLERDGAAYFPDAPTERGVKHVRELCRAAEQGFEAYVFFVVQMADVRWFSPNDETHPAFGDALRQAKAAGVHIWAADCAVTSRSLEIHDRIEARL